MGWAPNSQRRFEMNSNEEFKQAFEIYRAKFPRAEVKVHDSGRVELWPNEPDIPIDGAYSFPSQASATEFMPRAVNFTRVPNVPNDYFDKVKLDDFTNAFGLFHKTHPASVIALSDDGHELYLTDKDEAESPDCIFESTEEMTIWLTNDVAEAK
jgi:hypothetical protein